MPKPFHLRFSDIRELYGFTLRYGLTGYSVAKITLKNVKKKTRSN